MAMDYQFWKLVGKEYRLLDNREIKKNRKINKK
jgi:hypothetical protein